jgi:phenylacetate-CoA ligase
MENQTKSLLEKLRPSVFADAASQAAFKLQLRLADSEWFQSERLEQHQLIDLKKLVRFAVANVPYWRAGLNVGDILGATRLPEALAAIPTLSRSNVMKNGSALRAATLPKGHAVAGELKTSGSTGGFVSIQTTDVANWLQHGLNFRGQLWAGREFSHSIAVVRRLPHGISEYPSGSEDSRWDATSVFPFPTGRSFQLNTNRASLDQIWKWLEGVGPGYLLTYPSIVQWMAQKVARQGALRVALRGISTIGEVVTPELREIAAEGFGLRLQDIYSSQEAGCLAINCPDCAGYHVQSEVVIVEVLDTNNRRCQPGEIGRVVVTPLFNYAMPLFRYDLGDFAQVGPPCACGRGLPVLDHIEGRRRNLLTLPDGRQFWPSTGARQMRKVITIRQHQYRQTAPNLIEILLATDELMTPTHEAELRRIAAASFPGNLDFRIICVPEIPQPPSGKHEEFLSLITS